jgi:hypothetical protein
MITHSYGISLYLPLTLKKNCSNKKAVPFKRVPDSIRYGNLTVSGQNSLTLKPREILWRAGRKKETGTGTA